MDWESDAEVAPREENLGGAAGLFAGQGFASTTARQITERESTYRATGRRAHTSRR